MRVLFVGQGPSSKHPEGARALEGKKGSGAKLAALCGMTNEEFVKRCGTLNLLGKWYGKSGKGDAFPQEEARGAADLLKEALADYGCVIFLGNNVARAFRTNKPPILTWFKWNSVLAAVVPHPSGINRWYNEPENKKAAEVFLRKIFSEND